MVCALGLCLALRCIGHPERPIKQDCGGRNIIVTAKEVTL